MQILEYLVIFIFILIILIIFIKEFIRCITHLIKGYGAVIFSGLSSSPANDSYFQLVKPGYASATERVYLFFMTLVNLAGSGFSIFLFIKFIQEIFCNE